MKEILEPDGLKDALQESEKRFRHLASLMPIGVYSTDEVGHITFYNDRAAEIWGRHPRLDDPAELLYCGASKLYGSDGMAIPHGESFTARALREKRSFRNKELYFENSQGTRMAVLVSIDPIFNNEGDLTGAINVFHDITQKKRAEDDLRRLSAIVESSRDAIISRSLDGTITSWNLGAERIFGFQRKDVLGRSISIITPVAYEDEELTLIGKICRGEEVEQMDTVRISRDGRQIHITLTLSPIKDGKGRVVGVSMIARDNSDQMQIRHQLQMYNEQLKQLSNHKDQFIGMASHELKTPLTVIRGHLEWMALEAQHNGHDGNNSSVNKALIHIEKLSDLVSNLLDVTKVDQGMLRLNFATFNLNDVLNESIDSVMATESTHQIILESCAENIPISADRQRMEQALTNLLLNAIKFSPDADKVVVKCLLQDNVAMISVTDFGIGIPADQLDKIFIRFFRVESLAPTFSGLGVGLYITNEIIKRHSGHIWVESEEGKGSTFYMKIPLTR